MRPFDRTSTSLTLLFWQESKSDGDFVKPQDIVYKGFIRATFSTKKGLTNWKLIVKLTILYLATRLQQTIEKILRHAIQKKNHLRVFFFICFFFALPDFGKFVVIKTISPTLINVKGIKVLEWRPETGRRSKVSLDGFKSLQILRAVVGSSDSRPFIMAFFGVPLCPVVDFYWRWWWWWW